MTARLLKMCIDHANIVFIVFFLSNSLLRLTGEVSGYGNILFKGMPLLPLSLSLGFLLTLQVVFKGLEVYSVIFAWIQEKLSRTLMNIANGKWRAVDWSSLMALFALVWPVRDMVVRWNIVHQRWAGGFPVHAEMFLHTAALLYILFMILQGLYLVAVMVNTEVVCRYSKKEQMQKYARNLIIVNLCLLMHDAIWIMTTLAIEGGEDYLLKVFNLGCVGLVLYELCALVVLVNLQMAISYQPDGNIDCDDPTKAISLLQQLIPVFFLLSIAREFHSLILPSSFAVLLPVSFFAAGSFVIVLKVYLLHRFLAVPNFKSLLLDMRKRLAYKITAGSAFIGALTIISLVVNLSQGYDSYRCWLSQENPIFRPFLAIYTTSYIVLMAYEGLLVIWQLSYQDHTQYMKDDSTKRSLVITVLSACEGTSAVFTVYHTIFIVYLPDAGLNYTTLARIFGPVLFHISMFVAYLHLKDKCYRTPVQVMTSRQSDSDINKHETVSRNKSLKAPKAKWFNHPFQAARVPWINPGVAVYHSFLGFWHSATSSIPRHTILDSLLVPLALLRCLMFGHILAPFLASWLMTRFFWCAYILVCVHWTMVMHRELHSTTVIRKCYSSICRIVTRGDAGHYPSKLFLGTVFLLVAVTTVLNIFYRASHSAHEWAGQRTLALQIILVPLLGVHVYAILLQALLLYGATTASDSTAEATENSEVPVFTENLPQLKHINIVLLMDHLIFMVLRGDSVTYEWPLLIFHLGSIVTISILERRGKEIDKPSGAPNESGNIQADPTECCLLARWIPLQSTGTLMKITAVVGVGRLALKVFSFQGDWIVVVIFRLLTSLTFAVVNYYIYRSLTKQLIDYSQKHSFPVPKRMLTLFLYIIVGCFGIAEVGYAFYCQWTVEGDGLFLLDLSLSITILMNVALIIHEDILVIFLVSLDSQVEEKYYNLKQALQLVLHLNLFYAGFGAFSSYLAWHGSDSGSLVHLLGHLTCAILVPTMASPVLERMYNDINKDLQCNEMGTNQEGEGFNERVHGNLPRIPEEIRQGLIRNDEE